MSELSYHSMIEEAQIKGIVGQIARIREQANLFIERELARLNIKGILPAHGSILYFLFKQNEPVAMKVLVEETGRVKSTITGMVNTLEQYGYVEKFQSSVDGRVMLVKLTDKGKSIEKPFLDISEKLQNKVYGDMPQEDRETLIRLLMQVCQNLETGN